MTFKMVAMLKRRSDLTVEEFRLRYERDHVPLAIRVLRGRAIHYVRRYLTLFPEGDGAQDYDVLTELWYADRAAFDAAMAHLAQPDIAREIAEDEDRLFDRPSMRFYLIDEVESPEIAQG